MRARVRVVVGALTCLLVAGCTLGGSGTSTATSESTSSSDSSTSSSSSSSSTSPEDTATTPDTPSESESSSTSSDDEAVEPDLVIRTQRDLTLEDAFRNEGWDFGSYTPVTGTGQVPAFAAEVYCNRTARLEFRIQLESGRLVATGAQDLQSGSSDEVVEFTITTDGRAIKTDSIKFKETTEIEADLDGVSVVEITVAGEDDRDDSCDGSTALLTSLRIVPASEN